MQKFVIAFFVAVTVVEFLVIGDFWGHFRFLPGVFKYMPELTSLGAAAYVIFAGVNTRFSGVRTAYWLGFGAALFVVVAGVLANGVEAGPLFAGLRIYLRALPWFFVAAVAAFNADQLRGQLRALMFIAILQLPIALFQRYQTTTRGHVTGDYITGTLLNSGIVSIFLICCLAMASAFYVRKLMTGKQFLLLFFIFLIPTTINETKITLLLLPVGLLVAFVAAAETGKALRHLVVASLVLVVAGSIFIPVYDSLIERRQYGLSVGEFFGDRRNVERYLVTGKGVGARQVGRVDGLVVPTQQIAKDPVTLAFGYGIGNASESALGESFTGQYGRLYAPFLSTTYSRFILEIGVLGVAIMVLLYFLVWSDARVVARVGEGVVGAFGAGWVAVTVVIFLATAYAKLDVFASLGFLYAYFSGFVMSLRMRFETERASEQQLLRKEARAREFDVASARAGR